MLRVRLMKRRSSLTSLLGRTPPLLELSLTLCPRPLVVEDILSWVVLPLPGTAWTINISFSILPCPSCKEHSPCTYQKVLAKQKLLRHCFQEPLTISDPSQSPMASITSVMEGKTPPKFLDLAPRVCSQIQSWRLPEERERRSRAMFGVGVSCPTQLLLQFTRW